MYGIRQQQQTSTNTESSSTQQQEQHSFLSGIVRNQQTNEIWTWSGNELYSYVHSKRNIFSKVIRALSKLILSFVTFFIVTSITAIIVRVLTSSGVVIMFPLFSLIQRMGCLLRNTSVYETEMILSISYPWMGAARDAIRTRYNNRRGGNDNTGGGEAVGNNAINHTPSHLVVAHLTKVFLYYLMYEACQPLLGEVLYGKSMPASISACLFGYTMILEYFNMVFIRSALR